MNASRAATTAPTGCPLGPRLPAEEKAECGEPGPQREAELNEEVAMIYEVLIPRLKERDARRLRAYLEAGGDRKAAAEKLGMTLKAFSRQWRQTVIPALRSLAEEEGINYCG